MKTKLTVLIATMCLASAIDCWASTKTGAHTRERRALVTVEVYPKSIALNGREARRQILLSGYRADGAITDLTDSATFRSSNPKVADVGPDGVVHPRGNGKASLIVRYGHSETRVPIEVLGFERNFNWSFENHVESVLAKQGCNAGPCHGAGSGKGGFRLTLRGYDPSADFVRLCQEGRGRRVVRTDPGQSLLLRKPSLALAHQGGLRLRRDSLEFRVISEWISAGAAGPLPRTPKLLGLQVYPVERTLMPGSKQRLAVQARFSDGHSEDVTHWARYASNEESIARVDESGRVRMLGVGETAVSVSYLGKVAFSRVSVPFPNRIDVGTVGKTPRANYVDDLVLSKLAKLHLMPSGPSSDPEFLRRVYLDTTGTLPTPAETRAFLADRDAAKRARLIDALLARPEYVDYWTYKWADLVCVNRDVLGSKGMWAFYSWLRRCVDENRGWDRVVRDILTASGDTNGCGPANFYRMGAKPEEFAETVSQAFLGIRVSCAKCHNHPFEKWTQSDYYRMASVFSRVGSKAEKESSGAVIYTKSSGEVDHPRLGRPLAPAAFDGPVLSLDSPADRRAFLADWMTAPNNPYFARSVVNRVWKQYMGRGLVEPVDDMRLTNPASNEPLLAALSRDFIKHGFDLRYLTRTILNSRAYQASSAPNSTNAGDDRFYSRYLVRRLAAEPLLDAICQVTGQPEKFSGMPRGARAISLPDTRIASAFLDVFGRPARQVTCDCERNMDPNVAQALHFISAKTLNEKVSAKGGIIERLLDEKKTDQQIVDELYITCLCRTATSAETATALRSLRAALGEPRNPGGKPVDPRNIRAQVFGDLLWAMLSSPEFVFNH